MAPVIRAVYIGPMLVNRRNASISRVLAGLAAVVASGFAVNTAFAQGPPPLAQFEAEAPKIGEPLPDITILDDLGNPVNLRELADENYKVLVLGCLT